MCIAIRNIAPHHVSQIYQVLTRVLPPSRRRSHTFFSHVSMEILREDRVMPAATYVGGGDLENGSQSYRDRDSKSVVRTAICRREMLKIYSAFSCTK